MEVLAIFLAIIGISSAQLSGRAPAYKRPQDIINLRSENINNGDGTYRYLYENDDGTIVEESGYLKPNGNDDPIQVAQGSYQYYDPSGILTLLRYIADERGFQPTGDHLPTPPPIPPAIQKSLDIIYAGIARGSAPVPSKVAPPTGYRPPKH